MTNSELAERIVDELLTVAGGGKGDNLAVRYGRKYVILGGRCRDSAIRSVLGVLHEWQSAPGKPSATQTRSDDAITATCSRCGRMVYAIVNRPECLDDEHGARLVELVRDGNDVQHMSCEAVRAADWNCECDEQQQPGAAG